MKTGLESLDTGASKITYRGNEGPKSPQQIASMEAGQESTLEEIFNELIEMGMSPEDAAIKAREIYNNMDMSSSQKGIGNLAMADPMLVEQYQQYVFEMEEQGLQPMSFEEFVAQARAGMNKGGIVMQGGVKNYLGKQKTVSGIPVKWQSGPDKPDTELAYITKAEKNLLLKEDIHGSLQDGPNTGPGGIMSLDSQGDFTEDRSGGRRSTSDPGPQGDFRKTAQHTYTPAKYDTSPAEFKLAQAEQKAKIKTELKRQADAGEGWAKEQLKELEKTGDVRTPPGLGPTSYMDKAKELILGPTQYIVNKIGKASMVPFLKYRKNAHLKTLGTDDPNVYEEDETYKAIVNALNLAEQGELSNKDFQDFMPGGIHGKKLLNFGPDQGGDGQGITSQYPYPYPISTAVAPAVVPPVVPPVQTANPFLQGSNLPFSTYGTPAHGAQFGVDQRMFSADGGRIGYAGGGIADLRQGYFLGKLVKKIGRGIKKVVKSPIGKLAMLAAPLAFGPGKSFFMDKALPFLKTGKGAMTGIAALSALPLIFGESQEEDEKDYYADATNIFDKYSPDQLRQMALAGELPQNEYPFQPYYAADGGRIGYDMGGDVEDKFMELVAELREQGYTQQEAIDEAKIRLGMADGGRVGLMNGGNPRFAALNKLYNINDEEEFSQGGSAGLPPITQGVESQASQSFSDDETPAPTQPDQMPMPKPMMAGRMNPMMMRGMNPMMMRGMNPMMARGMMPRMMAQEGGLMDLGGMEKDYRNEGGFVPIGGQERADDVPARLSKNEFVFTADAVRAAGGGDIDKGAEVMENMMENLEKGGKVSKESQGLKGARDMFATAQRLEGVL
jgi:hypothetical protein